MTTIDTEVEVDREIGCERDRKTGTEREIGKGLVNVTGRELGEDLEKLTELGRGGEILGQ